MKFSTLTFRDFAIKAQVYEERDGFAVRLGWIQFYFYWGKKKTKVVSYFDPSTGVIGFLKIEE